MSDLAQLQIGLKFGQLDSGKIMQVRLTHDNSDQVLIPDQNNRFLISQTVKLPDSVILTFSGKDLEQDTKLDSNGNIVQDLFVEIESLSLSGFEVPKKMFYHIFTLNTTNGQQISTAYVGFNGIIKLELIKNSVFSQIMSWKTSDQLTQN